MMLIPTSDHVRGMRHVRGAASIRSLAVWRHGTAGRARADASALAARAMLQANRRALTVRRRGEGGGRHG